MKITEKNVSNNLHRFNEVYPETGTVNDAPKGVPLICYCSNGKGIKGWAEVDEISDLGLEQLILKSWVTKEEFLSW